MQPHGTRLFQFCVSRIQGVPAGKQMMKSVGNKGSEISCSLIFSPAENHLHSGTKGKT
jgi:hypothetical protein